MSFFLAYGEDARAEAEKKKVDRNFIRLKDGESVRGFLLSKHFPAYQQHNDFERKIHPHTCADPKKEKDCLSCQHNVPKSKKWAVPIYNVDTKRIELFEASGKAVKNFYSFIDEYEEDALTTPITIKRSGSDQTTTYSVMPVRVKKDEQALFVRPDDVEVTLEFYEAVLAPPDEQYLRGLLGLDDEDDIKPIEDDGAPEDESFF